MNRTQTGNLAPAPIAPSNRVYVGNLSYTTTWKGLKDHMRQAGEVSFADVILNAEGRSKGYGIVEFKTLEIAQNAIQTLNNSTLDGRLIFLREDREPKQPHQPIPPMYIAPPLPMRRMPNNYVPVQQPMMRRVPNYAPPNGHMNHPRNFNPQPHIQKAPLPPPQPIPSSQEVRTVLNNSRNFNDAGRKLFIGNLPYSATWKDLKDTFKRSGNVIRADILENPSGESKGAGVVVFERSEDAARAIQEFNDTFFAGRKIYVREDKFASLVQNE